MYACFSPGIKTYANAKNNVSSGGRSPWGGPCICHCEKLAKAIASVILGFVGLLFSIAFLSVLFEMTMR